MQIRFFIIFLLCFISCSKFETEEIDYNAMVNALLMRYKSPEDSIKAFEAGKTLSNEITNALTDFTKDGDLMVHVSTFCIIEDVVYMTYYANRIEASETPSQHIARFVKCSLSEIDKKEFFDLQGAVGSGLSSSHTSFDGKTVTELYDTILMCVDNRHIFLMWTAALDGLYTRLFQIFDTKTGEFGPISYNYFTLGNTSSVMDVKGVEWVLRQNRVTHRPLSIDLGIMQKVTSRREGKDVYYYTGCYANRFNCIIKSKDLVTWEYVSSPDFPCVPQFENTVYVKNDRAYYFCRQEKSEEVAFLSFFDLEEKKWSNPVFINDSQSRNDFFEYMGYLYAFHAPYNRNHIAITAINTSKLSDSHELKVAEVPNCFYPYSFEYKGEMYISYTKDRQHIYLSKFTI